MSNAVKAEWLWEAGLKTLIPDGHTKNHSQVVFWKFRPMVAHTVRGRQATLMPMYSITIVAIDTPEH
ncbi:MAG TPA: hypothetical protein VK558_11585 [Patescibacteria group bacterium]|nr:hypothetical protein [Patescibacteria group bacterium]